MLKFCISNIINIFIEREKMEKDRKREYQRPKLIEHDNLDKITKSTPSNPE